MRAARLAASLAALLLTAPAAAGPLPTGWERAVAAAPPLTVTAAPVALSGGTLSGLALTGAWVLTSDSPDFGGLSGLLVADGRLYAVSDKGWWFGAGLTEQDGALQLVDPRLVPMRDGEGDTYTKAGGDAEDLTRLGERLMVSFERDHRVMALRKTGRMGGTIQPRSFEQFRSNKGLEALAALPDGRLIAFAERAGENGDAAGVPMFLIDPSGGVIESRLPSLEPHSVTGADLGPDGQIYLVLREYSLLLGVSIRVMRYRLGAQGFPLPETAETLAAFEDSDGIDNMEGISLERGADGRTRLWLISDDNFRSAQRTLLLRFELTP